MRKNPLKSILVTILLLTLVLTAIYFLEKLGLIKTRSAGLYLLVALVLALVDIFVSLKVNSWLNLLDKRGKKP